MAVTYNHESVKDFDAWYEDRREDPRTGCLEYRNLSKQAGALYQRYTDFKR